jgi:hypothetical protein
MKPIDNELGVSKRCNWMVVPEILRFLSWRDPATLSWYIVAVCVFSIQRQYILISICICPNGKGLELFPFLVDYDSSASMMFEIFVVRVCTAFFHCKPAAVEPRFALSMLAKSIAYHVALEATAEARLA